MGTTDWAPAVGVLATGFVAGGIAIFAMRGTKAPAAKEAKETKTAKKARKRQAASARSLESRELTARRDMILQQLKELELGAVGRAPAEVTAERTQLELRLAKTLRELDQQPKASAPSEAIEPEEAAPEVADRSGRWGYAAIVLGLAGFGALLGLSLQDTTSDRPDGASMSGGMGGGGVVEGQPPPDPALMQIMAAVQASPDRTDLKLALARALLDRGMLFDGFVVAKEILAKEPENPQAMALQGSVRIAMGQAEQALEIMEKAAMKAPRDPDMWARRADALSAMGRHGDAAESWEKAASLDAAGAAKWRSKAAAAKERVPGQPYVEGPVAMMPGGHPPAGGPPAAAAPAMMGGSAAAGAGTIRGGDGREANGPTGPAIRLAVSVDPSAQAGISPNATVFVIVRPDGMTMGPPTAVRRLPISAIPAELSLDARDSMNGSPLPEKASVEVRIDSDGNAATKDPNDPIARASGVVAGGSATTLVLKRGGT